MPVPVQVTVVPVDVVLRMYSTITARAAVLGEQFATVVHVVARAHVPTPDAPADGTKVPESSNATATTKLPSAMLENPVTAQGLLHAVLVMCWLAVIVAFARIENASKHISNPNSFLTV